jgi:hypothetical protein
MARTALIYSGSLNETCSLGVPPELTGENYRPLICCGTSLSRSEREVWQPCSTNP